MFHNPLSSEEFSTFPFMLIYPSLCEATGSLLCTLLSASGHMFLTRRISPHTSSGLQPPVPDSELDLFPTGFHASVANLLDCPDLITFQRAPRRPSAALPSLPLGPPIILTLRGSNLKLHPIPLIGCLLKPSIPLAAILATSGGPRKGLKVDSVIYRVIEAWNLNHTHAPGATIVFPSCESAAAHYLIRGEFESREAYLCRLPAYAPATFVRGFRSNAAPSRARCQDLCPTLVSARGSTPIHLDSVLHPTQPVYYSVYHQALVLGIPITDPLITALLAAGHSADTIHSLLCQGFDAHAIGVVFAFLTLSPASPLHGLASPMRINHAFCGVDTLTAALRACGVPHVLVAASDINAICRDIVLAVHGATPGALRSVYLDATSVNARDDSPDSDLFAVGFPCLPFSPINRVATDEQRDEVMNRVRSSCSYVWRTSPKAVMFENLASFLSFHRRTYLRRLLSFLPPTYHPLGSVICPSKHGGQGARPRMYLLFLLQSEPAHSSSRKRVRPALPACSSPPTPFSPSSRVLPSLSLLPTS